MFGKEFILYSQKELLALELLGPGKLHYKITDFVGDFVAIAISSSRITLGTHISEEERKKLSTHCGLTKNEMEVPLIVLDCK